MKGCVSNLKAIQITSDSLFRSAFPRAHLWNRIAVLWEFGFSYLLSVSFYSLYLFKLGLAPQITDLYGKVAFTGESACCSITLSSYNKSWKSPFSRELWSMWKSLSVVRAFPAILAGLKLPAKSMDGKHYLPDLLRTMSSQSHQSKGKMQSQDYLPKGYHAHESMTLQYLLWACLESYSVK